MHQYRLGTDLLERNSTGKDLDVLEDNKLIMRQQCFLEAKKVSGIQRCIRKKMASRSRDSMRPHLKYCIQFWSLQFKKDRELPETVQQRL